MRKLRLAVAGCGEIAAFLLLMAKMNRNILIVGCADIRKERARKYAAFFRGAKAYDDYLKMVDQEEPDAVYLAVPHHLHYPMMKELVAREINILCEKPITTDIKDALKIIDLARLDKVKIGVNYQYRYDKACYRLVMAANNGDLGQLHYGVCNVPWHRGPKYFKKSSWHGERRQSGGGTLITQGSHALDILLQAFAAKPLSAVGVTRRACFKDIEVEDLCMGTVELEGGALLQINSSMIASPEQPMSISIYGSKGTAHYKGWNFYSKVDFLGVRVPSYNSGVRGIHALGNNLEAFRRWILFDALYHNKAEDSLPVLAAVQAIYRSADSKMAEEVELE